MADAHGGKGGREIGRLPSLLFGFPALQDVMHIRKSGERPGFACRLSNVSRSGDSERDELLRKLGAREA